MINIISVAKGYSLVDIKPFINSCYHNLKDFNLYVVTDLNREEFSCYDERLIVVNPHKKLLSFPQFLFRKRFFSRILGELLSPVIRVIKLFSTGKLQLPNILNEFLDISVNRYQIYKDIIEEYKLDEKDTIILSDSRDVLFQSVPENVSDEKLYVSEEWSLIGHNQPTYCWVKKLVDTSGTIVLYGKKTLCSGLTFGSKSAIVNYLQYMTHFSKLYAEKISFSAGYDQGLHNIVCYTALADVINPMSNCRAEILTFSNETDHFDSSVNYHERYCFRDGYVYLKDLDKLPFAIHQYERHSEFGEKLRKDYENCLNH